MYVIGLYRLEPLFARMDSNCTQNAMWPNNLGVAMGRETINAVTRLGCPKRCRGITNGVQQGECIRFRCVGLDHPLGTLFATGFTFALTDALPVMMSRFHVAVTTQITFLMAGRHFVLAAVSRFPLGASGCVQLITFTIRV